MTRRIMSLLLCSLILYLSFSQLAIAENAYDNQFGFFGLPKPVSVLSWEWVDEEEYLVQDEYTGQWGLGLPGANAENPVTTDVLAELLPAEITAVLSDKSTLALPLEWDYTPLPKKGAYQGTYTLTAALPKKYVLNEKAPELTVLLDLGGGKTMVADSVLKQHIVKDSIVQPPNVKINLFDYGVTSIAPASNGHDRVPRNTNLGHYRDDGVNRQVVFAEPSDWNLGINKNRLLLFGDGILHGGLWNKGAGSGNQYGKAYAGMEGIVKNILEKGYPSINTNNAKIKLVGDKEKRNWELIKDWKLAVDHNASNMRYENIDGSKIQNLSQTVISNWEQTPGNVFGTTTESLDYLFDPAITHDYKKAYTNVSGLFQMDDHGYYYYDMRKNFAELDTSTDQYKFILYDAPATLPSDGSRIVGNFFPFNKGALVFDGVSGNTLTSNVSCSANGINHYFGLTMDVDFRQPVNGKISAGSNKTDDMIFEFSGDDDVWIYIDDVLVLDLGGIHSEIYGTINFATGDVYIGRAFGNGKYGVPENPANKDQMVTHTTLKALFEEAGGDIASSTQWIGNTFASNTDHELKMFYLERGNYDSSLTLRFNLVPRLFQQIKKVDQDGRPLENVEFALYGAEQTADGYTQTGDVLTKLKTDRDGLARFIESGSITESNPEGEPFNFADRYTNNQKYYILKETATPPGYRSLPQDIVLEYNPETAMLVVVNPWVTGAYASFTSTISGNHNITYGGFDTTTGDIKPTEEEVTTNDITSSLIVALPMLLEQTTKTWKALYGSNVSGFSAVQPEARTQEAWNKALLTAFLYQCSEPDENFPSWYLYWNENTHQLEGSLSDLPGRADRYLLNNTNGDMKMVYAIIQGSALASLGIEQTGTEAVTYEQLGAAVNQLMTAEGISREKAVNTIRDNILSVNNGFRFLNTDQFSRNFRSLIYIPNEQRELRVWKVDQDGFARNGAEFTLYQQNNNGVPTDAVATGVTGTVNGREGVLVFTPSPKTENGKVKNGYAEIHWARSQHDTYYLKETKAPEGCHLNQTVIPIYVGIYSIYADAGTPDNNVTVMAGVGKLAQTMKKYAADEEVNITLRDITATAQVQPTGSFQTDGWTPMLLDGTDVARSMNLHYGKNALVNYGLHDEDGGQNLYPYFVTDTGFITARVKQNWSALNESGNKYGDETTKYHANKSNLEDTDITSLFSLLNVVVVTDQTVNETKTGGLTISKTITGEIGPDTNEYLRNFKFKLKLMHADGTEFNSKEKFYFYGTDKSGYISSGVEILLHHDESITILGLPEGTRYTVTEMLDPADGYTSIGGSIREGIIVQTSDDRPPTAAEYVNARGVLVPFAFTKVSAENTNVPLSGARFILYWWNGAGKPNTEWIPLTGAPVNSGWTPVGNATSTADGLVDFGSLAAGTYRLIETAAPDGYILPQAQWQILVIAEHGTLKIESVSTIQSADDKKPPAFVVEKTTTDGVTTYQYKLLNMSITELPFTGGRQTHPYMILGASLFCTAAAFAVWYSTSHRRKKSRVRKC